MQRGNSYLLPYSILLCLLLAPLVSWCKELPSITTMQRENSYLLPHSMHLCFLLASLVSWCKELKYILKHCKEKIFTFCHTQYIHVSCLHHWCHEYWDGFSNYASWRMIFHIARIKITFIDWSHYLYNS